MSDPYVYPGTFVLRNRLGITDPDFLDKQERALVVLRSRRGIPRGNFDLGHLRASHRHLFQDIYDWAGELRTVEISKGNQQFQFRQYIPTGMADVHRRLVQARYLRRGPPPRSGADRGPGMDRRFGDKPRRRLLAYGQGPESGPETACCRALTRRRALFISLPQPAANFRRPLFFST